MFYGEVEYWLYLHFSYSDSALYRSEWNEKLDGFFKKYNLGNGRYEKNYVDILIDRIDYKNLDTKEKMEIIRRDAKEYLRNRIGR